MEDTTTVIINRFDGGHAEDVRTENTNECETCDNYDVFSNPHMLKPYIDQVAETVSSGVVTDQKITDVDSMVILGVTEMIALGQNGSSDTSPTFFRKTSTSDITSPWQNYASAATSGSKVAGTLCVYKGKGYALGDTASAYKLVEWDGTSTVTDKGSLGGYAFPPARPFVHPEDNILYMGAANIISKYDGTTFTGTAFTLPNDKVIVSLTNYGAYLVIVCRPKNGVGNSTMYFWGRDTSLTTVQESIDLGSSQVNIVENVDNQLWVASSMTQVGNFGNILQNRLFLTIYAGGSLVPIKEVLLGSLFGTALNVIKRKMNNKIFFGFSNDTSIYCFGKNKAGRYFLSHNRGLPSGTSTLWGISFAGDIMWTAFDTALQANQLKRTVSLSESQTYNATSSYRTTINPNMSPAHRGRKKKLISIQVLVDDATTGATVLKYSVDGSAFTTCVSQSNASNIFKVEALAESTGTPFQDGIEYQFQVDTTGNVPIKEIRYRYQLMDTL